LITQGAYQTALRLINYKHAARLLREKLLKGIEMHSPLRNRPGAPVNLEETQSGIQPIPLGLAAEVMRGRSVGASDESPQMREKSRSGPVSRVLFSITLAIEWRTFI